MRKATEKTSARENAHYSRMISRRENNTHNLFNDAIHIKNVENTLYMRRAPGNGSGSTDSHRSPYRFDNLKFQGPQQALSTQKR